MSPSGAPPRNHALWLAPLVAVAGLLSYFTFFSRWAIFRDHPVANLLILGVAVAWSISGARRAWPSGGLSRAVGIFGVFVSSALTLLLLYYCYVLSYQLPSAELAAERGTPLPAISLTAHDGSDFELGTARDERMVLVFYRGFW